MHELSWAYEAEDRNGNIVHGTLQAINVHEAVQQLRKEALSPLSLKQQKGGQNLPSSLTFFPKTPSLIEFAIFAKALSELLSAGVSIAEALSLLEKRTQKKEMKAFLNRVLLRVRSGTAFSAALKQDRVAVPNLMIALVGAGEQTGVPETQLKRLAETLEASVKLRRDLFAQLAYPIALAVLVVITIFFLSHLVLPQFETIFLNADAAPPTETKIVLAIGAWVRAYGIFLPLGILILMLIINIWRKQNQFTLDTLILQLPALGAFQKKLNAARYFRSLGALLDGGTPLAAALPIARQAITNQVIETELTIAEKLIRAGQTLSLTLNDTNHFPSELIHIAEIGEKTGRLGSMMLQGADLCDQDIKRVLERVTAISGPLITALMGLVTAIVIASVMSGVLSLNDAVY